MLVDTCTSQNGLLQIWQPNPKYVTEKIRHQTHFAAYLHPPLSSEGLREVRSPAGKARGDKPSWINVRQQQLSGAGVLGMAVAVATGTRAGNDNAKAG